MGDINGPGFFDAQGQQQFQFGAFDGDDALQLDQSPPINPNSFLNSDTFGQPVQSHSNDSWSTGWNQATVPLQQGGKTRLPQVWRNTAVGPKNGPFRNQARMSSKPQPIMKEFWDAATRAQNFTDRLAANETRLVSSQFYCCTAKSSRSFRRRLTEIDNRMSKLEKRLSEVQAAVTKFEQANAEMMGFLQAATEALKALAPEAPPSQPE